MKKCPFCAEDIQEDAKKCRYCGEWLNQSATPVGAPLADLDSDNGTERDYSIPLRNSSDGLGIGAIVRASSLQEAIEKALREYPGTVYAGTGSGQQTFALGKFSCPNCKSQHTDCRRNIGCALVVFFFISFGLGLIMIPFLPYHCACLDCGNKWKA